MQRNRRERREERGETADGARDGELGAAGFLTVEEAADGFDGLELLNPHVSHGESQPVPQPPSTSSLVPIYNLYGTSKRGPLRLRAAFAARENSYVRIWVDQARLT